MLSGLLAQQRRAARVLLQRHVPSAPPLLVLPAPVQVERAAAELASLASAAHAPRAPA
jgi:hypothetical protein